MYIISEISTLIVLFKMFSIDRNYETVLEENYRKEVFRENLKRIEMHNYLADKGLKSYRLGINQFADWVRTVYLTKTRFVS